MFAILFCHCSSSEIGYSKYEQLDKTAKEKFTKNYDIIINKNQTYAICLKRIKTNPPMPSPPLNFFIYDINNEKIIYQSNLANGNVMSKLKLKQFPELLQALSRQILLKIFTMFTFKRF